MSPVQNHLSAVNDSLVLSGLFQYSLNTPPLLTCISPGSPSATGFTSSPASLTCTPGSGDPTDPGTRVPSRGFESVMPVSVIPYRRLAKRKTKFVLRRTSATLRTSPPHIAFAAVQTLPVPGGRPGVPSESRLNGDVLDYTL